MYAKIKIDSLGEAEKNAREILEHIEAIKRLQGDSAWKQIRVEIDMGEKELDSGN